MGCAGGCNTSVRPSYFLRIPASRMLRRGVRALLRPARSRGHLPFGAHDGLHVCMSAWVTGCTPALEPVRMTDPKAGRRRPIARVGTMLEQPTANTTAILPVCLSASLPVRPVQLGCCLDRARDFGCGTLLERPYRYFKVFAKTVSRPSSLSGKPFLRTRSRCRRPLVEGATPFANSNGSRRSATSVTRQTGA